MERANLRYGQKIRVVPKHTYNENGSKKHHPEKIMYVRELKSGTCGGFSHTKNSEHIYGIFYDVIQPLRKNG